MIELKNVSKSYLTEAGEVRALQGIDLSIDSGDMIILSGKSGCGKTTLLNLIGGLDQPSSGEIRIGDKNLCTLSEKERTLFRRREVGTIFQSFNLIPMLTVEENIALPRWLDGFSQEEARPKVESLLQQVELTHRRNHRAHELSGGEQQRVAIARALINSPKVILADEPTGNLDSQTGLQVLSVMTDLNRKQGQTIIIATHSREADALANRIIKLKDGKILR
ncbi:MAG: macrolide ABC transporter ATP-binding protein [Deltaproteobacteria bacterium RBG_13_43_22]|nr:MAG: macrolide ABC transporter ATP-binding protein [Deltaproteobacteria bacterium RBG_13_43_22]